MNAIEKFIADKHPSPKQAQKLIQYFQGIEDFFATMAALPLSAMNALQIGEWIEEIAERRETQKAKVIAELLDSKVLAKKGNAIEGIKHLLKQWRFPEVTRIENELKAKLHDLGLPRQVSVEFPKDLEGDKITFHVAVRSIAEWQQVLQALKMLPEEKVSELFLVL
jgi:hypothetical protein